MKIVMVQHADGQQEILSDWISNTDRLADDVPMPDPQQMTHDAIIRRANVDDRFFEQLCAADGYGTMGDTD